uniref:Protein kinase domain-containing protein n=1 Tax=Macrostomum lignano TaxID=282301 RepID=A0A1I8J5U9_9PLAT
MAKWTSTDDTASVVPFVKIDSCQQLEETFQFGEKLGEGAFGSVLLALRISDGHKFAVKKMVKKKDPKTQYGKSWENEIHVLSRHRHPNIVAVDAIYESENSCYLFMELCDGGNLADELQLRVSADVEAKPLWTARGHRLPHPCPFVVKLTDFGLSIELRVSDQSLGDNVGTPAYQAPEIVKCSSYTEKCDVWSLGIIMFSLVHGSLPYSSRSESDLIDEIKDFNYGRLCNRCKTCSELSAECRAALSHLLVQSAVDRWSTSEFMDSAWVTEKSGGAREGNIFAMMRNMNRTGDK